jgi:hypothetical protein
MQKGRILAIDAPGAIGGRFPRDLYAVHGAPRHALIEALRAFPHAASVQPFGETLHYSDARPGLAPAQLGDELAAWAATRGVTGVRVAPIAPGIEDAFMALMGADAAAA